METTTIAKTTARKNCTHTFSPFCAHIFFLSIAYRYMDVNSFYYMLYRIRFFLDRCLFFVVCNTWTLCVRVCDSFPADRKMHFFSHIRVCVHHYSVVDVFFSNVAPYNTNTLTNPIHIFHTHTNTHT